MITRSTTILAVHLNDEVALAGDGQVTVGDTIVKQSAKKIRRVHDGKVLAGFAGAAADALALFEKFEGKLDEYRGNLRRAALELAKEWRTDRILRHLQAQMVVASIDDMLLVSGSGELIEPDEEGTIAIGSGGPYAIAAATALQRHTSLNAESVAREALYIASSLCIYTNDQIIIETLP